jgi:site-specific recombinase XerD
MTANSTEPTSTGQMGPALQPMQEAFMRAWKLRVNKPASLRFATYQIELLCEALSRLFPDLTPEQLTLGHLEEMVEQHVSGESGHHFKPSTLKQHVMYVRCIFKFWHKRGHLPSNPANDLVYCPTAKPQATRWIRNEEIAKLFAVANTEAFVDLRETALMYLMLDVGPRISELLALQMSDLHLESHRLDIDEGKRDQNANGGFGERATLALERYLAARAKLTDPHKGFIFIIENGSPLKYRALDKRLKTLAKRAGLDSLASHRFRATTGVRTYLQTRCMVSVKTKLRHKTLAMTFKYIEQAEQEIAAQHSAEHSVSDEILGNSQRPANSAQPASEAIPVSSNVSVSGRPWWQ